MCSCSVGEVLVEYLGEGSTRLWQVILFWGRLLWPKLWEGDPHI